MSTGRDMFQQADHLAQDWRVGTYEWWPAADRLAWSPELARLYGLTQAPVDEQGFTRLVHPEDRVRVEGETSNFLGSNVSSYSHMFRILRPDGTVRVILDRATIERDTAGNVRVIHGINIDVTDEARSGALAERPAAQTAAEQELTEAKALLESLFDNAPSALACGTATFASCA